jgi:hypothetical protein
VEVTQAEKDALVKVVTAIADTIKELSPVPSGVLYAHLAGHLTLESYTEIIRILTASNVIRVQNHLITWVGK